MGIGDARFELLANVFGFSVPDEIFPRKMYLLCQGEIMFKTVPPAKNRDKYTLFFFRFIVKAKQNKIEVDF